jgi:multicomponent Na+:H+ antiporter subunit C
LVQSSTYILLLAVGFRRGGTAPIFLDVPVGTRAVDPVVGALTLTDIVVGATVSALLLALAVQIYKHHGTLDPDRFRSPED